MFTLPKQCIIKKNEEFERIFRYGRSIHKTHIVVFYISEHDTQVGFSASKRARTKPKRNRIKRRLRELWRLNFRKYNIPAHIVLLGKVEILSADFSTLESEFTLLLKEIEEKVGNEL